MDMDQADLQAVLRGDDLSVSGFFRLIWHPADVAEAMRAVEPEEWPRLLQLVQDKETRADVLTEFDEGERLEFFEFVDAKDISPLLVELESDDVADLLADFEPHEQQEALAHFEEDERAELKQLLSYPEDSAGGIMQVERAMVLRGATCIDAKREVRTHFDDGVEVHHVWIVDAEKRLIGLVDMIGLILNDDDTPLADFMEPIVAQVTPLVDQEEVAALFAKYDLVALPVVDEESRFIGRILIDDIVDVLEEEADEDALRQAGTDVEELLYKDRTFPIAKVRLPWIAINLLGSLISAALLHHYEPVIEQVILIASFVPVITAMGGNVGTQSATILTRGLATGRIDDKDILRTIYREFRVGLLMGIICGSVVGLIAGTVFSGGKIYLGVVVAVAMVSAMTTAAVVGSVAPAAMRRFRIDPAIASGPFVTTANDIVGIVIYMSTALMFIEKLKG
ncbi:MAG: magnesium transporter [Deltaproteobacteria bacterium]|nr:magnesium transporter [Deltaproteobacteria bacterium]